MASRSRRDGPRAARPGQLRHRVRARRAPRRPSHAGATPAEVARLRTAGATWPVAFWGLDGLARAGLLLYAAAGLAPGELEALVEECFVRGDTRERQAVLRTLALLPDPRRFVPLAVDACRTSVQPVFEAITCENPYPVLHFPESSFNQIPQGGLRRGGRRAYPRA